MQTLVGKTTNNEQLTRDDVSSVVIEINELEHLYLRYHREQVSFILEKINQLIYLKTLQLFPSKLFFTTGLAIVVMKLLSAVRFRYFREVTTTADRQLAEFYVPITRNAILAWIHQARTTLSNPEEANQGDILELVYYLNMLSNSR